MKIEFNMDTVVVVIRKEWEKAAKSDFNRDWWAVVDIISTMKTVLGVGVTPSDLIYNEYDEIMEDLQMLWLVALSRATK